MDKNDLLRKRLPEGELEIEGVGTIRFRALTRDEAMLVAKKDSTAERERVIVSAALLDPELTYQDVADWQKSSPAGELEEVTNEIARLSRMLDGSAKEVTQRFPGEPGSEVRPLPGGETGDDGGGDAADDGE